jgi:hypothetical protein
LAFVFFRAEKSRRWQDGEPITAANKKRTLRRPFSLAMA